MALRKQKQYDWKDSNLALFGSDTERSVKKESAQQEPAWHKTGKKVGLQIWRIVKFKVTEWPKEDYGKFYDGDSYIILNTYKYEDTEQLEYDVHFWIGSYSTQDEYCTAAYKTVELDTYLDDVPVQHREVQGFESDLFKSYFKHITIMSGGAESGFRHVKPEEYRPRLLHFHGDKKGVKVTEIRRNRGLLDNTDVYILDLGLQLYQWNGSGCNKEEKMKAMQYLNDLQSERGGKCKKEVLDEDTAGDNEEFFKHLDEDKGMDQPEQVQEAADKTKVLLKLLIQYPRAHRYLSAWNTLTELYNKILSDASGKLKMEEKRRGSVSKKDFDPMDVFILDAKDQVFVWIGSKTTKNESRNAMAYAHNYLSKTDHPLVPICCIPENGKNRAFEVALAA